MLAKPADGGCVADAGLGHNHCPVRGELRQAGGPVEVDGEVVQVAVVDAEDPRAECGGARCLLLVDHLGEHVHVEGGGHGGEVRVLVVGEHREHEQDCVRAEVAGGVDLHLVDDEVLAQDGQVRCGRDSGEVVVIAPEVVGLAQHGDGGGVAGVDARYLPRLVVLADGAQRRGRGLALHDVGGARGTQGVVEGPL